MAEEYYTPKIEDIRVGYICQYNTGSIIDEEGNMVEGWQDWAIGADHNDTSSSLTWKDAIERQALRTKFITVQEIVDEGWTYEGPLVPVDADKPFNVHKFTKGIYWLLYDFIADVVMIAITMRDVHSVCIQRFDCPSINELRYIISRLNLR